MIHSVLIAGGTTGTIDSDTINGQDIERFLGEVVNVHSHDENGNPVEMSGVLEEILD